MARPVQPIRPAEPLLVVDGHTPAVLRSPPLVDARGLPYDGRQVTLELVPRPGGERVHPTLSGPGVSIGDGAYTLALLPRDLWLRLAPYANAVVYQATRTAEHEAHYQPMRVVWRAAEFPVIAPASS
jgi:hypothetical protein